MNSKIQANYKLLHADDEESLRAQIRELLSCEGFEVDNVCDGVEAINAVQAKRYDVILLDIAMPKVDGIEVLHFIKDNYPTSEVIMLTGVNDLKIAVECMKEGAFHFLAKPFITDELIQVCTRAAEHSNLRSENSILKSEVNRLTGNTDLIGESESLQNVLSIADRVAPTDTSVLIHGSSGTGKELIANYIYKKSVRSNKPFVAINCAAIPDTLLESELFGHEKGAFTDARSQKQGLIELADKGTLFLDEVGDISPIIQPKLLRFVQTGEFRRIGGNNSLRADVRIISATNKDLREEVKQGRFREDLLYRLNVISLVIPPLRERKEDIPLLVQNILTKKLRTRIKKQISPEAIQLLMNHDWPGNIRELENVIESAAILSNTNIIQPKDILLPDNKHSITSNNNLRPEFVGSDLPLKETERLHITAILNRVKGDKKVAAKILGISLKTLYTKIAQYQLK